MKQQCALLAEHKEELERAGKVLSEQQDGQIAELAGVKEQCSLLAEQKEELERAGKVLSEQKEALEREFRELSSEVAVVFLPRDAECL